MPESEGIIAQRLEEISRTQKEQSQILAILESRILMIHDEVRRSAETIARLKLLADNAKKIAHSQGRTLDALRKHLGLSVE